MSAEKIIAEAKSWIGTPFHHQAMIKGVGVDCAHFLIGVFSAVGLSPVVQTEDYPPDWHFHRGEERFMGYLDQYAEEVQDPRPGDVAMFKFGKCVSHGAIIIEWPVVIHSYYGQGVVVSDATGNELGGRVHSFWRIKGSE